METAFERKFHTDGFSGKTVVAGFSGGADSTALLYFLKTHEARLNCRVTAVHINHGLRGEESFRDERAVQTFCRENGIPLLIRRIDIRALSEERRKSEELCGREERYRVFFEQAHALQKNGETSVIATAHTLSDDLETVLFHLARGCALDGLCGIPESRTEEGISILRPMLSISRQEVEEYCRENRLSFVTDSTNLSPQYARNLIRLEVIPKLKELNPSLEESFCRMRETLNRDRDFLNHERDALLEGGSPEKGWDVQPIIKAAPALRSRAAAEILRRSGCEVNARSVSSLEETLTGRTRSFSSGEKKGGKRFSVRGGRLFAEEALRFFAEPVPLPKTFPSELSLLFSGKDARGKIRGNFEKKVYLDLLTLEEYRQIPKIYRNLLFFAVDYDTITDNAVLRVRAPGDVISLPGKDNGHKTIKKLFQEAHLPSFERETRLLLALGNHVLRAEGFPSEMDVPDTSDESGENIRRILIAAGEPLPGIFSKKQRGKDELVYGTENER